MFCNAEGKIFLQRQTSCTGLGEADFSNHDVQKCQVILLGLAGGLLNRSYSQANKDQYSLKWQLGRNNLCLAHVAKL